MNNVRDIGGIKIKMRAENTNNLIRIKLSRSLAYLPHLKSDKIRLK